MNSIKSRVVAMLLTVTMVLSTVIAACPQTTYAAPKSAARLTMNQMVMADSDGGAFDELAEYFRAAGYNVIDYTHDVETMTAGTAVTKTVSTSDTYVITVLVAPSSQSIKIAASGSGIDAESTFTASAWENNGAGTCMLMPYVTPSAAGTITFKITPTVTSEYGLFVLGSNEPAAVDGCPKLADKSPSVSVPAVKIDSVEAYSATSFYVYLNYDKEKVSGVEYRVYKKGSSKKLVNATTSLDYAYVYGLNSYAVYYVQARGYVYHNGEKVYGKWSSKKYFLSPPVIKMSETRKSIKKNSINLQWYKVSGATEYIVYCSTKKNSGYKKIGTTTKTSMKVTKFNGKKINLKNTKYFKIVAVTKISGKTYKSSPYIVSAKVL